MLSPEVEYHEAVIWSKASPKRLAEQHRPITAVYEVVGRQSRPKPRHRIVKSHVESSPLLLLSLLLPGVSPLSHLPRLLSSKHLHLHHSDHCSASLNPSRITTTDSTYKAYGLFIPLQLVWLPCASRGHTERSTSNKQRARGKKSYSTLRRIRLPSRHM